MELVVAFVAVAFVLYHAAKSWGSSVDAGYVDADYTVDYAPVLPVQPDGVTVVYFGYEAWYRILQDGDYAPRYERAFKTQDELWPRKAGVKYTYDTAK